jgi:hypothetical protein
VGNPSDEGLLTISLNRPQTPFPRLLIKKFWGRVRETLFSKRVSQEMESLMTNPG